VSTIVIVLTVLAGGAIGAAVVVALVFARIVMHLQRQAGRERNLLLNQLLHVTGNTWQEPPHEQETEPEPFDDPILVLPHLMPE